MDSRQKELGATSVPESEHRALSLEIFSAQDDSETRFDVACFCGAQFTDMARASKAIDAFTSHVLGSRSEVVEVASSRAAVKLNAAESERFFLATDPDRV